ncbi:MAG: hypothetical protein WCE61_11880 [Candidatus Acidiferrum sp.]
MDEHHSGPRERRLLAMPPQHSDGRIQYLLEAEAQIFQSISVRAPVASVLNEICCALDRQIGNMVSLISLPTDDLDSVAETARNASLFGLYIFSSTGIFAENGEEIGSLEMYCCTPRNGSSLELQLIERAACLAAIALERDKRADRRPDRRTPLTGSLRGNLLKWPVSTN